MRPTLPCSDRVPADALKVAPKSALKSPPKPAPAARYLNNDEAAAFLRLSPRTLEKQRVIGGGPRFRKFGRRVMYAVADLETWADARSFEMRPCAGSPRPRVCRPPCASSS